MEATRFDPLPDTSEQIIAIWSPSNSYLCTKSPDNLLKLRGKYAVPVVFEGANVIAISSSAIYDIQFAQSKGALTMRKLFARGGAIEDLIQNESSELSVDA